MHAEGIEVAIFCAILHQIIQRRIETDAPEWSREATAFSLVLLKNVALPRLDDRAEKPGELSCNRMLWAGCGSRVRTISV